MKILFITPSYKPAYVYGGPAVSVSELAEALVHIGLSVTVYTTTANGKEELQISPDVPHDINGVTVYYFKRQTGDHTHVSFGLWQKLWHTARVFDVIHLQSWWSLLILGASMICRAKKCKYVVSPRGMLTSYSFQNQHNFIKKAIHKTVGLPLLKKSVLHATTVLEWEDCAKVNKNWKGFILPNIIRFPSNGVYLPIENRTNEVLTFGFLSRIDPKKGLELLFQSLAGAGIDFQLKVAGSGEEDYIASLKKLASRLKISDNIKWCGWIGGDTKFDFLRSIDVFVLTSYNENFANAVLESLITGTPVLLTKGVGLADYVQKNRLGWVTEPDVASITEALKTISLHLSELQTIQQKAPSLVKRDFERTYLAKQYTQAYSEIK